VTAHQGDGAPASGACGANQSAQRGRRAWLAQWVSDLSLGVRLAVGGGRTSKTGVARLVLGTIGIGIAVSVLLVGASVGPMFDARADRQYAQLPWSVPEPGVDPLYTVPTIANFRDRDIIGTYLRPAGERAPLPPGVQRLPGDGEIVVSPALADLLAGSDGELLRPRFPQRVVGTIGQRGVTDVDTLSFYAGDASIDESSAQVVYRYGHEAQAQLPTNLVVLIAIGTVVLLVPVFVFVATSARIAGAERDRRLAALRLVGADARQARRIAAAESLVSAGTGLLFGIGVFLLFRSVVGNIPVLGVRPYPDDVAPPWPLVLLIVLAVPGLAMLTAQIALRRTIIEPLGVVRRGRPARRRLWWRLVPVVAGPILLVSQFGEYRGTDETTWLVAVITGAALLLLGIPALLPWLLERAVARVRGGRPATQLAVRRLQLDSGTPARVVGGVAVVLAGAIALEAVLAAQEERYGTPSPSELVAGPVPVLVNAESDIAGAAAERVRSTPGVDDVTMVREVIVRADTGEEFGLNIVDCAAIVRYAVADGCTDGDVFQLDRWTGSFAGREMRLVDYQTLGAAPVLGEPWRLPAEIRTLSYPGATFVFGGGLVATPGALGRVTPPDLDALLVVQTDEGRPDMAEHIRNAMAVFGWRASVTVLDRVFVDRNAGLFQTIRNALLGGALFTLLLAGVSMLVLALEQVRERRRPLAALAATGVPTSTLARSLLWQNTVPVLLAVLVAVVTGVGLAALVFELLSEPFQMDWLTVTLFSAASALLVLLVTAMTLPTLRSATRLAALRTE
jgi:hypothetical protein